MILKFDDIEKMTINHLKFIEDTTINTLKKLYDFDFDNIGLVFKSTRDIIYITFKYKGKMPKVMGTIGIFFKYLERNNIGFINNNSINPDWKFEIKWDLDLKDYEKACLVYENRIKSKKIVKKYKL